MCRPTNDEREREKEREKIGDITKLKPDARQTKKEGEKERRGTYRARHKLRL